MLGFKDVVVTAFRILRNKLQDWIRVDGLRAAHDLDYRRPEPSNAMTSEERTSAEAAGRRLPHQEITGGLARPLFQQSTSDLEADSL